MPIINSDDCLCGFDDICRPCTPRSPDQCTPSEEKDAAENILSSQCNCCKCIRCPISVIKRLCQLALREEQHVAPKERYSVFEGGRSLDFDRRAQLDGRGDFVYRRKTDYSSDEFIKSKGRRNSFKEKSRPRKSTEEDSRDSRGFDKTSAIPRNRKAGNKTTSYDTDDQDYQSRIKRRRRPTRKASFSSTTSTDKPLRRYDKGRVRQKEAKTDSEVKLIGGKPKKGNNNVQGKGKVVKNKGKKQKQETTDADSSSQTNKKRKPRESRKSTDGDTTQVEGKKRKSEGVVGRRVKRANTTEKDTDIGDMLPKSKGTKGKAGKRAKKEKENAAKGKEVSGSETKTALLDKKSREKGDASFRKGSKHKVTESEVKDKRSKKSTKNQFLGAATRIIELDELDKAKKRKKKTEEKMKILIKMSPSHLKSSRSALTVGTTKPSGKKQLTPRTSRRSARTFDSKIRDDRVSSVTYPRYKRSMKFLNAPSRFDNIAVSDLMRVRLETGDLQRLIVYCKKPENKCLPECRELNPSCPCEPCPSRAPPDCFYDAPVNPLAYCYM